MKNNDYQGWSKAELFEEIKRLKKRKKYGLVWEDKPEDVVEMCKDELPVVKEIKNKAIFTDKNKPVNLLIEGDNYHSLSVLNYTHNKAIDVIYIDPPYNTGARDWKYNNDYVDINDAYRHSKWLSFMSKRLRLVRNILTKDGVLICTIDHNELNNLGVLLNEIFSDKEITCVTIVHNPSGIQGINFSHNNEYAYFIHHKNKKVIAPEERSIENADIRQFMNTAKGNTNNYLRESGKSCFYPIFIKNNKIVGFGEICDSKFHPRSVNIKKNKGIIAVYPIDNDGVERKWVFARNNVGSVAEELSVKFNKRRKKYEIFRTKKKINYKTVWIGDKFNAKTQGTQLLKNIIKKKFPFPKSLYAVCECIRAVVHDKNSIILDFFAGSGTTGHAVLELNKEDDGNRQFILCTNNENNICTEVCYPKVKKVIKGYLDLKRRKVEALGGNLKYFKTDFVDAEPTDKNKKKLTDQATEMLCIKEGTFEQILNRKHFEIFKNSNHYTGIIFDQLAIPEFINYNENYTQVEYKKSIMEPFFSDERWKSEKTFIEFLEKSGDVEWWFKNGDRDKTFFAVLYDNGEQKLFYIDFIIRLKDGRIGLFDTKMGITQKVAGAKVAGLYKYIKGENKKGKKIFGGIVTNTDRNYRGRWIHFDRTSKDFKDGDFSNWKDLEL